MFLKVLRVPGRGAKEASSSGGSRQFSTACTKLPIISSPGEGGPEPQTLNSKPQAQNLTCKVEV